MTTGDSPLGDTFRRLKPDDLKRVSRLAELPRTGPEVFTHLAAWYGRNTAIHVTGAASAVWKLISLSPAAVSTGHFRRISQSQTALDNVERHGP